MKLDDNFKHGIIWQDIQHQQLLEAINKLVNSVTTGKNDKELFYKTINFIKEYISSHFSTEELYMKKYNYPETKKHIEEHQLFIDDFIKFISQSIYNDKESAKLLYKLNEWFLNHIKTTDKQLAKFLSNISPR